MPLFSPKSLEAILFDMDGVLYDSMKNHARTWVEAFNKFGIDYPAMDAYINEGRRGDEIIKQGIRKIENREATDEEINEIYKEKSRLMDAVAKTEMVSGMKDLMDSIRNSGKKIIIVTGSSQPSLLDQLKNDFGVESREVVSGKDVKTGKPNPEPYLIGLEKAECRLGNAIVLENAPLGIESAIKAGIYTIAINTGPLEDELLTRAGAAQVFKNTEEIREFLNL